MPPPSNIVDFGDYRPPEHDQAVPKAMAWLVDRHRKGWTNAFAATLDGHVPFERCQTLDRAVAAAAADATRSEAEEPVVLLSPACASYDQYPNYEKRGDHFRDLVRALPGVETRGA